MIAFKAEYAGGELQLQEEEISDAKFFKFDQLPEIPFKGSIAHAMIMHVTQGTPVADDTRKWLFSIKSPVLYRAFMGITTITDLHLKASSSAHITRGFVSKNRLNKLDNEPIIVI